MVRRRLCTLVCICITKRYLYDRSIEELVVVDFHWLETEPIRLTTFGIVMSCTSLIFEVSLFDQIVRIELALKYFCFQPLIICKIYIFNPFY